MVVDGEKPNENVLLKGMPKREIVAATTYLWASTSLITILWHFKRNEINSYQEWKLYKCMSLSWYLQHYSTYMILIISIWSDFNCPHALI